MPATSALRQRCAPQRLCALPLLCAGGLWRAGGGLPDQTHRFRRKRTHAHKREGIGSTPGFASDFVSIFFCCCSPPAMLCFVNNIFCLYVGLRTFFFVFGSLKLLIALRYHHCATSPLICTDPAKLLEATWAKCSHTSTARDKAKQHQKKTLHFFIPRQALAAHAILISSSYPPAPMRWSPRPRFPSPMARFEARFVIQWPPRGPKQARNKQTAPLLRARQRRQQLKIYLLFHHHLHGKRRPRRGWLMLAIGSPPTRPKVAPARGGKRSTLLYFLGLFVGFFLFIFTWHRKTNVSMRSKEVILKVCYSYCCFPFGKLKQIRQEQCMKGVSNFLKKKRKNTENIQLI